MKQVALVGARGHGASYFDRIDGLARLVAVADPRPPGPLATRLSGARWHNSLTELLADVHPDVVVIATPTHTHSALAVEAMQAGCDVLLEKPPTPSLSSFEEVLATAASTGQLCQIGFQTYGSEAVPAVRRMIEKGEIGEVTAYGALGTWVRTAGYWARSAWAGRRSLDGQDVIDGVVTNPLAHAVATALLVSGLEEVTDVDLDLFHANDIEADDTSSGVVTLASGLRLGFGFTLCAPQRSPAQVLVRGTRGTIRLAYETDKVEVNGRTETFKRVDLLEDLLRARETGAGLRCDVTDTTSFMQVVEAVRKAEPPRQIPEEHIEWHSEGAERHPVVANVEKWCERAAVEGKTFTALGAPWTL